MLSFVHISMAVTSRLPVTAAGDGTATLAKRLSLDPSSIYNSVDRNYYIQRSVKQKAALAVMMA
jgi:hypothetical protein